MIKLILSAAMLMSFSQALAESSDSVLIAQNIKLFTARADYSAPQTSTLNCSKLQYVRGLCELVKSFISQTEIQ